jgi:hypothetical protein
MLYYSLSVDSILGCDELVHYGLHFIAVHTKYAVNINFIGYNYSNIEVFQ